MPVVCVRRDWSFVVVVTALCADSDADSWAGDADTRPHSGHHEIHQHHSVSSQADDFILNYVFSSIQPCLSSSHDLELWASLVYLHGVKRSTVQSLTKNYHCHWLSRHLSALRHNTHTVAQHLFKLTPCRALSALSALFSTHNGSFWRWA